MNFLPLLQPSTTFFQVLPSQRGCRLWVSILGLGMSLLFGPKEVVGDPYVWPMRL